MTFVPCHDLSSFVVFSGMLQNRQISCRLARLMNRGKSLMNQVSPARLCRLVKWRKMFSRKPGLSKLKQHIIPWNIFIRSLFIKRFHFYTCNHKFGVDSIDNG